MKRFQYHQCTGERLIVDSRNGNKDLRLCAPLKEYEGDKCKAMHSDGRMYILDKAWLYHDVTNRCLGTDHALPMSL